MITLENLTLVRGGQTILQDSALKVKSGGKVAVCGASGCGKSSLLFAIAGCFAPETGKIEVKQTELRPDTISKIRQFLAFINQEPVLGAETVREALMLPFTFKSNHESTPGEETVAEALQKFKLSPGILEKLCSEISGGEKQRIAIIRALLMKKKIFLADEPTSALDPLSASIIREIFRNPEFTVLSVSHDSEWLSSQDEIYEITDKRLVKK